MLELSGKEDGDEDLMEGTLDVDDRDKTQNSVGNVPQFQEPL